MSKARDLASQAPTPSTVSTIELGYLDGVTSAVQTQIDSKAASSTVATLTGTQTLTNKTLTSPSISSPTVTGTVTAGGGVGTNGQVLQSTGSGIQWATPSAGGWTLISEQVPSAVTSVTFSSIPSTYKHLMLEWIGIIHSTTGDSYGIRINNDSSAIYSVNYRNSTGQISRDNTGTNLSASNNQGATCAVFGYGATTTDFDQAVMGKAFFYDYYDTTKYKHIEWDSSYTATGISQYGTMGRTIWRSTSAITSINIVRTSGTTATLSTVTNGYIRLWGSA